MKKFSDFWLKRKNESRLDFMDNYDYDSFGILITDPVGKYQDELKQFEDRILKLDKEIEKKHKLIGNYEDREILLMIDETIYLEDQISQHRSYLNSLVGMKVVFLYSTVEKNIKFLINVAYPSIDVKPFFTWKNIVTFFEAKGIKLSDIEGYEDCVDLRKLNNRIKHSGEINDEIKKIREFRDKKSIEFEEVQNFYDRVIKKTPEFVRRLKDEIKKDLFEFSDERLGRIVRDYYERMDDETYERFLLRIKKADSI